MTFLIISLVYFALILVTARLWYANYPWFEGRERSYYGGNQTYIDTSDVIPMPFRLIASLLVGLIWPLVAIAAAVAWRNPTAHQKQERIEAQDKRIKELERELLHH